MGTPGSPVGHPRSLGRLISLDDVANPLGNIHLIEDHGGKNLFQPVSDGIAEGSLTLFEEIAVRRDDAHVLIDQEDGRGNGVQEHGVELLIPFRKFMSRRIERFNFHDQVSAFTAPASARIPWPVRARG